MPLDLTRLDITAETVNVDDAAEFTVTIGAQDIALDVSGATVPVQEDTPLDVSAAEVDIDITSQTGTALDVSAATVPTEQQSPVKIEDSGGAGIDPATEGKLESVRALLDRLDDALTSVGSDEVRTTIQNGASPVAFPDTGRRTVSTAGSPEALVSAPAPVASGVEVKALPSNAGTAFVFISGESKSDSYPLAPGDEVFMPVDDASKVIVDVDSGGDTVSFIAA